MIWALCSSLYLVFCVFVYYRIEREKVEEDPLQKRHVKEDTKGFRLVQTLVIVWV